LKIFDLHCDTITKMVEKNKKFEDTDTLHVNLPGIISSNTIAQVFACFVLAIEDPDQVFERCNAYIDAIETLIATHSDRLVQVKSSADLTAVCETEGKTAVIISIEGATPLKGKPELIDHFYRRGVRLLTIAWDDNEFCGTVFGNKGGLTGPGEQLVQRCNDLGVAVDVSHASDQAFYDIAAATTMPFTASHSNARSVCPNDRNLTDEMITIIADRGGIIGLTFGSGFISPKYHSHEKVTRNKIFDGLRNKTISINDAHKISHEALSHLTAASLPRLVEHARHILNVGGEDCLGLGSDFDGVDSLVQGVTGVQSVPAIVDEMQRQGISSRVIDKICYENAIGFFKRINL